MAENNENKRGISEKEVLEWVIELVEDSGIEGSDEVLEKLHKMVEQRSKKREYKPNEDTLALGEKFAAEWTADEWTSADVKIVLGLEKAQQANGVCSVMVNTGKWRKKATTRSVTVYEQA